MEWELYESKQPHHQYVWRIISFINPYKSFRKKLDNCVYRLVTFFNRAYDQ